MNQWCRPWELFSITLHFADTHLSHGSHHDRLPGSVIAAIASAIAVLLLMIGIIVAIFLDRSVLPDMVGIVVTIWLNRTFSLDMIGILVAMFMDRSELAAVYLATAHRDYNYCFPGWMISCAARSKRLSLPFFWTNDLLRCMLEGIRTVVFLGRRVLEVCTAQKDNYLCYCLQVSPPTTIQNTYMLG